MDLFGETWAVSCVLWVFVIRVTPGLAKECGGVGGGGEGQCDIV
jgi:hypothetical protein